MDKALLEKGISATKSLIVLKFITGILYFFVTIFLIRVLTETNYGIYSLFYSTIGVIVAFASLGLNDTLNRYIPEYYQRGEYTLANWLYRSASLIRLVANIFIIFLIYSLWHRFGFYLKIEDYQHYFFLFSPIIIFSTEWYLINVCLNSYFLQKYTQLFHLSFIVLKGIGYLVAFFFKFDLLAIIVVDIISFIILLSGLHIIYIKKIPKRGGTDHFSQKEKKRIYNYAICYNFSDLGDQLLDINIDNLILVYFLNPAVVGAYSFFNRISKFLVRASPIHYLIDVVRPLFFSYSQAKKEIVPQFYQVLVKIIYLFYSLILIILFLHSRELIQIISGGKFIEFSIVLPVLFFFQILSAFQLPLYLVAQLRERADIIFYSKIFGIYNLIADILMIKWWGIMGAVVATGSALLFKNIFIWWFVRKDASFNGMGKFFILLFSFFIISFFSSFLLKYMLGSQLVFIVLNLILIIVLWLFVIKYSLTRNEKEIIVKVLPVKMSSKLYRWLNH